MAYKHGIYGSEVPTSLVPMTEINAGLPVVFGTAPVHLATDRAAVNTPVLCYKYSEAVAALGYSDDWEKYTLCEVMRSQFSLYNMAPVVFVNVLDPAKHKAVVSDDTVALIENKGIIEAEVLLDTLEVKVTPAGEPLKEGTDYTAAYNDEDKVIITALDGGLIAGADTCTVSYDKVDASLVTAEDIVGGVSAAGKNEGLEVLAEVYPRFRLIPGIIIAPGWSHNTEVAAVMKSKADTINGRFKGIAIADIPTETVTKYTDAPAWKTGNNYVDPQLVACWPKVSLGGKEYHLSTQLTGVLCATDAAHNDVPYWSPSNNALQCDSAQVDKDDEVFLDVETAAYLNGQGIVTAINENGWVAWGNRTSAYPATTDVKDTFIAIRRMFCWVNNTLITTFWSKIDNPINKRLIATIVDSANIWLNGLTAKGYLLGGRVEFREDENTTTDLMDGKINFHVYITPPSPARDIEFVQEYDTNYISTLFE